MSFPFNNYDLSHSDPKFGSKSNFEAQSNPLELKIYPLKKDYLGCIALPNHQKVNKKVKTVIILDRSGSMGSSVPKLVNSVLPKFFAKLSYDSSANFHLIAFDSIVEYYIPTIQSLLSFPLTSRGGTIMYPALEKLHRLFEEFKVQDIEALRILTISDGEIADPYETKTCGDELAAFASQCNISVNSQAVRFFTSKLSPDTTAICSLLQLNNIQKSNLVDISSNENDDIIAEKMANLFLNDGLDKIKILENPEEIFYKYPWDEKPFEKLPILPGQNTFWLHDVPKSSIKIDESSVKIKEEPKISPETFHNLLETKMNFLADRMKILKVVNTEAAEKSIEKIVDYMKETEDFLKENSADTQQNLPQFQTINTIAKDEKVNSMDNQQKAEYLRNNEGANSQNRVPFEFLLGVIPEQYPHDFILQEDYETFNNYLGIRMDNLKDDELMPNFLKCDLQHGYILYECQGVHSVNFLKKAASSFDQKFNCARLKVIPESKLPKRGTFQVFTCDKNFWPRNFLRRIGRQNQGSGIDTSTWKVLNITKSDKGTVFDVNMDEKSAEIVRKVKCLFYWVSTVKFKEVCNSEVSETLSTEEMRNIGNSKIFANDVKNKNALNGKPANVPRKFDFGSSLYSSPVIGPLQQAPVFGSDMTRPTFNFGATARPAFSFRT